MDFDELMLFLLVFYAGLAVALIASIRKFLEEDVTIVRFLPESSGDAAVATAARLPDPGGDE